MKLRFAPVTFSTIFCSAYVGAFALNWPLFLYYPLHHDFSLGPALIKGIGPAMAWYGLMVDAAGIAAVAAFCVPDRMVNGIFRSYLWVVPCVAMGACVFLLRRLFA